MNQTLYLYRYYKEGLNPFRSTSNLNDNEIIHFMEKHFPAHTWFHADPKKRIDTRRKIERWLHHKFLLLGGKPQTKHPCYFTLDESLFLTTGDYSNLTMRFPSRDENSAIQTLSAVARC